MFNLAQEAGDEVNQGRIEELVNNMQLYEQIMEGGALEKIAAIRDGIERSEDADAD